MAQDLLSLGTANWGQFYGLAGRTGQLDANLIRAILDEARALGISAIDTASAYGCSHSLIGKNCLTDFSVTTKLPEIPKEVMNIRAWVLDQITESMTLMNIEHLDGVLLHQPEQLFDARGPEILEALVHLKLTQRTHRIGISVYQPEVVEKIESLGFLEPLDIVQAPLNAFDHRMAESGWMQKFHAMEIQFRARSIFLQGLLLTNPRDLPAYFLLYGEPIARWWSYVKTRRQRPVSLALQAVKEVAGVTQIIVGVNSPGHLREIAFAANQELDEPVERFCVPDGLRDPRRWPPSSSNETSGL